MTFLALKTLKTNFNLLFPRFIHSQNSLNFKIDETSEMSDLASLRLKYRDKKDVFLEEDIFVKEPFDLFRKWLDDACKTPEIQEPNAVCLSTATKDGIPSSRFVLLKNVTETGLTFFTNYGSRKAKEINENPNVAMTFYWLPLRRQVRVEGKAEKIPTSESEDYFRQRPRDSQIGALASPQSQPIPSRDYLDRIESDIQLKLGPDELVPMPNWGGYLLVPHKFEFWQGQSNRLHDRIQFRRVSGTTTVDNKLVFQGEKGWVYERLAP